MRKDENLSQIMYENGVIVVERPVHGYRGLLVRRGSDAYVFIPPRLSVRGRAVILAEEYAHYQISTGDTVRCSDKTRVNRSEVRALRRAIDMLISPSDVVKSIQNGAGSLYELSESLDLPCAFVDLALSLWRAQYGSEITIGDTTLKLDPLQVTPKDPAGVYAELE